MIFNSINRYLTKERLVSKESVIRRRLRSEILKFGIKQGEKLKGQIFKAGVSSVSPSLSLADLITKMTFRALALRHHLPI